MIYETYPNFSPYADKLRGHFDDRFADPKRTTADRFVWDYWHIPKEYTFIRTPAFHYFPKRLYDPFHRHLVNWGREHLGCHDVSPTWLSYYVDGCVQHWHKDEPHGPLAFVLSLTKRKTFQGGRTIIKAKPNPLAIEPKFNRLTIFDPSLSHGVDRVKGVQDPTKARLVLHGWFVNPRVFWKGRLTAVQVQKVLDQQLMPQLQNLRLSGYISWRLRISSEGQVEDAKCLVDTLTQKRSIAVKTMQQYLTQLRFPKNCSSILTLPLVFSW